MKLHRYRLEVEFLAGRELSPLEIEEASKELCGAFEELSTEGPKVGIEVVGVRTLAFSEST